jgi:hypothetical protein
MQQSKFDGTKGAVERKDPFEPRIPDDVHALRRRPCNTDIECTDLPRCRDECLRKRVEIGGTEDDTGPGNFGADLEISSGSVGRSIPTKNYLRTDVGSSRYEPHAGCNAKEHERSRVLRLSDELQRERSL